MYHEVTYRQARRRRARLLAAVLVVVALALALFVGAGAAQANAREQAALSVRQSVLEAAKQCCAVEGAYPSSLEYLEEHYGLTVNTAEYVVNYEWFADNVLPSVAVRPR